MPDLGEGIEAIITDALKWIDTMNEASFFSVLAAVSLALMVLSWLIRLMRNPPDLDI